MGIHLLQILQCFERSGRNIQQEKQIESPEGILVNSSSSNLSPIDLTRGLSDDSPCFGISPDLLHLTALHKSYIKSIGSITIVTLKTREGSR